MSKLIMMCGIPGSGKSTYIKNHKAETDVVVSRDEIRFGMLKDTDEYFANENKVFASFIENIQFHLRHGQTVWADATHLTYKSRKRVLNEVKDFADEIEIVWIKTSIATAKKQNDLRSGRAKVSHPAIENMHHALQAPTLKEGFNEIIIVEESI